VAFLPFSLCTQIKKFFSEKEMKSEKHSSKIKTTRRETSTFKNHEQVYGRVSTILGNGHFRCACDDFVERTCHIRGNMRNRVYINESDIVLIDLLVGLSNSEHKGIISARYTDATVRELIGAGEMSESFAKPQIHTHTSADVEDSGFEFI